MSSSEKAAFVAKYRFMGLLGGGALGALVGVAAAGPKLHAVGFSALHLIGWVVGGTVVLGLIGYLFVEIVIARQAEGPGHSFSSSGSDSYSGGGSDDGGGGGDN